ncbi:hypothetical protein Cni_G22140 [Canna indica]|uniref:Uncharacterized protein n=1 Tax=Canna indica TaxID=4628 RepID=A0AAQ3KS61_9LILI|nr:hypothetical protein Cni_G22140 [Canna indica]
MIKDKESPCCPLGLIPSSRSSQQEPVEMLLGQRTTNCKIEKECNVPELASRNSYEKWVISTFTSLPANAYWKLSSFLPPLKVVDQKNYFGSRAFSSKDMQSPSSPLEANFQVKKSTEDTDCVKLAPFNSSSRANISCQSQNRSKLAKKVNHSSNTSSSGLVSGTSSDSVNSLNADCSNFLLHDIHIMEEAVKEYGRTHSKKRGKQYKRTIQQRVSGKKFFGNLDKAVPSSLSVKNLTVDDLNNNGQMDLKSCAPPIGDTDVSGLIVSPQKFPSAKFSCNNISCQNVASTSTQAADPSTFGVYTKNVHGVANISLHDNSLTASRHENVSEDASVVDSSLDSWSCNFTENFGDDIEVHASAILMKEGRASSSGVLRLGSRELDTPFNRINVDSCAMNIEMSNARCTGIHSNDILTSRKNAETVECVKQACRSNEFQPGISKRGRMRREHVGSQSINVENSFRPSNSQGPRGKNKKGPVWKKRQKSDSEAHIFKPKDVCILSPTVGEASDASKKTLKHEQILRKKEKTRRSCKCYFSDEKTNAEFCQVASDVVKLDQSHVKPTADSLKHNVERKCRIVSKQANYFSRSEYVTVNTYIPKVLEHHVHKKEGLKTSPLIHHETTSLNSCSRTYRQHDPANLVDDNHSRATTGTCSPSKATSPTISSMGYNGSLVAADTESGLHSCGQKLNKCDCATWNSKYFGSMHEGITEPAAKCNSCINLENRTSYTDACNLKNVRRTIQKCVPLWKKKSVVLDMGHDLAMPIARKGHATHSSDAKVDLMISKNQYPHPSDGYWFPSLKSSSKEMKAPSAKYAPSTNQSCAHSTEPICNMDALFNSEKIQNNGQIQKINPVANFERFICSASPIIDQSHCEASYSQQVIGPSFGWHQIPNISLKRLWHWYEEPGCFGLEVKAEDHRVSNNSTYEFNAYFVPYLSAVQLFGNSCTTSQDSKVEKTLTTLSTSDSLPIFSKLLPQPHKGNSGCFSNLSSTQPEPAELVRPKNTDNGELIFEFFESDQPPIRRPLYEKIRELVNDHLTGQIFGDPMKLESNLHDLHPASWFSVAWYPIYRIPYGKFRAAFLTYHSLSHFAHQSSSCSPTVLNPIVCPVVGLLAYNDKAESWFPVRDLDSKAIQSGVPRSNPPELEKERLRTLKQTAFMMSRAVVTKGNQKTVNQHPDHEFFLSRNW